MGSSRPVLIGRGLDHTKMTPNGRHTHPLCNSRQTTPPTVSLTSRQSYGGHSEGETPGPIPNPEAKPSSADGTAPARVWESRTPPDYLRSRAAPRAALDSFVGPRRA